MTDRKTDTYPADTFKHEHELMKNLLTEEVYEALAENNAMVAGGTLTSLFTRNEVNDFDIYFRTMEDMEKFLHRCFHVEVEYNEDGVVESMGATDPMGDHGTVCMAETDKSVMFTLFGGHILQVIAFDLFPSPAHIFDKFDFTLNMGAFDFKTEEWIFDQCFLKDLAQKAITFNPNTSFPAISLLRVGKYQGRGYKISKKDMLKVAISVSNLKMESWKDAKKHLSGMYGTNVDSLFTVEEDFSYDALLDTLDNAENKFLSAIATDYQVKTQVNLNKINDINFWATIERLKRNLGIGQPQEVYYAVLGEELWGIFDEKRYGVGKQILFNESDKNKQLFVSLPVAISNCTGHWNKNREFVVVKVVSDSPGIVKVDRDGEVFFPKDTTYKIVEFVNQYKGGMPV